MHFIVVMAALVAAHVSGADMVVLNGRGPPYTHHYPSMAACLRAKQAILAQYVPAHAEPGMWVGSSAPNVMCVPTG